MSRRFVAVALVAVFAVVLFGGCSDTDEQTIKNVMKDFYAGYNAEDWEGCLGHIDDTNQIGESTIESVLREARATTGEVTVESVTVEFISGASASVHVSLSYAGGSQTKWYPLVQKSWSYALAHKGGSWKIEWTWV